MSEPTGTVTMNIIPAQPGWYVARFMPSGEDSGERWDDYLSYCEIIAWSVGMSAHYVPRYKNLSECCSYEMVPLTVNGAADSVSNPWAIKSPQGRYTIPNYMDIETEAETLKELKELHDVKRPERAAI